MGTKQTQDTSKRDGTSRRRNRRQALALGGVAAAAAAVAAVGMNGGKKAQAGHDATNVFHLGEENDSGTAPTSLYCAVTKLLPAAFLVVHSNGGPGTIGIVGHCGPDDVSGSGIGVLGASPIGMGVLGQSDSGHGVVGGSNSNAGVVGFAPGDTPGVAALSAPAFPGPLPVGPPLPDPDGGLALDVIGKARFSTAGAWVVPAKADAVWVDNLAVTVDSHITVTFTGDPGRSSVAWVDRQATGFTVHLSSRCRSAVPFTYLIVEPGV